ncbi:MAG: hypothetical protein RR812_09050, partial [Vagococcus sp.]
QEEETIFDVLTESEQESFQLIMSKLLEALESEIPEDERGFKGPHMRGRGRHGGPGHGFGSGPMDPNFDPRDMFGISQNKLSTIRKLVFLLNSI